MELDALRPSLYLIKIKLEDKAVLISSLTGAIDLISRDALTELEEGRLDVDTRRYLIHRGHLTTLNEENERDFALAAWKEIDREARGSASIVICPSMDCNFRCTYCFESPLQARIDSGCLKSTNLNLSKVQVDAIFEAYPELLKMHRNIRQHITLFGGEPLWAKNLNVVEYIVKICSERKITLSAITNGYELTSFRSLLGEAGIKHIQVSLDGPSHIHNKKRITCGGSGTFDKILDELKKVVDVPGLSVDVRMNYDSTNMQHVGELCEILKNEGILGRKNTSFHANLISLNHSGDGKDYCTLKSFKSANKEHEGFELDCYTTSMRRSFENAVKKGEPLVRRAHYCSATTGMYVFCPDGHVYACWEGIGERHSDLGTFHPKFRLDGDSLNRWHRRNALALPQCQTCSHLFLCGGGCAIHAYERTGDLNVSECDGFKKKYASMVESLSHHGSLAP